MTTPEQARELVQKLRKSWNEREWKAADCIESLLAEIERLKDATEIKDASKSPGNAR